MPAWMGIRGSLYTGGGPVSEGPPFLWLSAGLSAHTLPSSLPQVFLQLRGVFTHPVARFLFTDLTPP